MGELPTPREKDITRHKFTAMVDVSKLLLIFNRGRIRHAVKQAYERFLELPVPIVLVGLWLAGLAVLGSVGLVLYIYATSLVRVLTGG